VTQKAPAAECDDLLIIREVDSFDRDAHTEDLGVEWHCEMLFEHVKKPLRQTRLLLPPMAGACPG
jgi:hypothetical protein